MSDAKNARRSVRSDVAALSDARAKRALAGPNWRPERGAYYVIPGHEDDPSQLYAVRAQSIVLQSRSGGFLTFDARSGPPVSEWWFDDVPRRTLAEALEVLADYDRRGRPR